MPSASSSAPARELAPQARREFRAHEVPAPPGQVYAPALSTLASPAHLEVGCGVGWRAIVAARANPAQPLIAIERTRTKFESFARRVAHHADLPHLYSVHADAVSWVVHAPPALQFSAVLFPYPNPEPGNAAQRWIRMPFFGHLLGRCAPGAVIEFRTNSEAYAHEVLTHAAADWNLRTEYEHFDHRTRPAYAPQTHFEKKYFLRGERLHFIRLRQN